MELIYTGKYCPAPNCTDYGIKEYYGFCAYCWVKLDDEERATLREETAPKKEIVTHRTIITQIPPAPWAGWRFIRIGWRVAMTAVVIWLVKHR